MIKARTMITLATAALLAAGTAATAQTATPDSKPPAKKSSLKRHAHASTTPSAGDMYLRAAGSEPAPKAAK
jgi:hypothetical protein